MILLTRGGFTGAIRPVLSLLVGLMLFGIAPVASSAGPVVGWGAGAVPDAVNGIGGTASSIAVGDHHSCAIQAETGQVVCWGQDDVGQAMPPDAVNGVAGSATAIAAGTDHNCAIQSGTDQVVCWGLDDVGQATPPDAVNGVSGTANAIAAGGFHSLAIAVPEPAAWLAQLAGLAGLGVLDRRRRARLTSDPK